MRICILTPRFPFPQYGGDALRINEVARHLKQQGHELILVSLSDEKNTPLERAHELYDRVYFVKRHLSMGPHILLAESQYNAGTTIQKHIKNYCRKSLIKKSQTFTFLTS